MSSMTVAPLTVPDGGRRERLRGPLLTIGALGAATLALHLRDPHQHGSWGECPLAAVGLYCPFCGGLRAVNDLTNGHLVAAASSNLLLVLAMPFAIAALLIWTLDSWRGVRRTVRLSPRSRQAATWVLAIVVVGFAVARNLPGSWLAP